MVRSLELKEILQLPRENVADSSKYLLKFICVLLFQKGRTTTTRGKSRLKREPPADQIGLFRARLLLIMLYTTYACIIQAAKRETDGEVTREREGYKRRRRRKRRRVAEGDQ